MMHNADEVGVLGHGFIYSGYPVRALVAIDIYREVDLIGHVRRVGKRFLATSIGGSPVVFPLVRDPDKCYYQRRE